MLFASYAYILVFLPIAVVVCLALQRFVGPKAAQAWILVASIYFYAQSNWFNLIYLFGSILANWLIGQWIEKAEMPLKKRLMVAGVDGQCGLSLHLQVPGIFCFNGSFCAAAWIQAAGASISSGNQLLYDHPDHVPG